MKNPLFQARESAGVSRLAIAAVSGRGVDTVRRLEAGQYPAAPDWATQAYGRLLPDPAGAYAAWRQSLALPEPPVAENPLVQKLSTQLAEQKKLIDQLESDAKAKAREASEHEKAWRRVAGVADPKGLEDKLLGLETQLLQAKAQRPRQQPENVDHLAAFLEGTSFAYFGTWADNEDNVTAFEKLRKSVLTLGLPRKDVAGVCEALLAAFSKPDSGHKTYQNSVHVAGDWTWRKQRSGLYRVVYGHRQGALAIVHMEHRNHVYEEVGGKRKALEFHLR